MAVSWVVIATSTPCPGPESDDLSVVKPPRPLSRRIGEAEACAGDSGSAAKATTTAAKNERPSLTISEPRSHRVRYLATSKTRTRLCWLVPWRTSLNGGYGYGTF